MLSTLLVFGLVSGQRFLPCWVTGTAGGSVSGPIQSSGPILNATVCVRYSVNNMYLYNGMSNTSFVALSNLPNVQNLFGCYAPYCNVPVTSLPSRSPWQTGVTSSNSTAAPLTYSPSFIYTPSPTPARTSSPSISKSYNPSMTPSPSPSYSDTPSATSSPSTSSSDTPTIAPSPSPSYSNTPSTTSSPSTSSSDTPTIAPSPSPSYSNTPSATSSPSASYTPTIAPSPSPSYSNTPSATSSPSASYTPTIAPSLSPSYSYSDTPSATSSPSTSSSDTPTIAPSPSPSYSYSDTPSATSSPSASTRGSLIVRVYQQSSAQLANSTTYLSVRAAAQCNVSGAVIWIQRIAPIQSSIAPYNLSRSDPVNTAPINCDTPIRSLRQLTDVYDADIFLVSETVTSNNKQQIVWPYIVGSVAGFTLIVAIGLVIRHARTTGRKKRVTSIKRKAINNPSWNDNRIAFPPVAVRTNNWF